jgi:neprilysin
MCDKNSLYVRKHFNNATRSHVSKMIQNIKNEFVKNKNAKEWMDEETKAAVKLKVDKMGEEIGFYDDIMNDAKLNQIYKFHNSFEVYDEWEDKVKPTDVNAYYHWDKNTIKFPAGILQGLFFNADRPQYMNYGGIGFVIGHEITHGFDDHGSQYNENGNLQNWWAKATEKTFIEKANCFIDQYGSYIEPLTGLPLNGINTLNENIADNGGIKQSYLAYVRWTKNKPREKKLSGLNFTPQQMFWISASQEFCSVHSKEIMEYVVANNTHA